MQSLVWTLIPHRGCFLLSLTKNWLDINKKQQRHLIIRDDTLNHLRIWCFIGEL